MPLDAPLPIDAHREAVVQTRVVRYEDLVLEEHPAGEASDPDGVSAALAAAAARDPGRAFDLEPEAARLILRLRTAAGWDPELPTYAELDTPADGPPGPLLQALCAGRRSFAETRKAKVAPVLRSFLGARASRHVDRLAPEHIELPSGRRARLQYAPGELPILAARVQDLFGLREVPRVAGGSVAVLVHLLAPSGRAVQVTSDLESFWRTTYAGVRKDLRGRYPKHAWPEDPLEEVQKKGTPKGC